MRYDYECDVVCKVTVLISQDGENEYKTYTHRTVEGIRAFVEKTFPHANLSFGKPIWVQR